MVRTASRGLGQVLLPVGLIGLAVAYGSFVYWHVSQNETDVLGVFFKLPFYATGGLVSPFVQWWLAGSFPLATFVFWSVAIVGAFLRGDNDDE
jgi:hypothetical protein